MKEANLLLVTTCIEYVIFNSQQEASLFNMPGGGITRVSVIMPVYNEKYTIGEVLRRVRAIGIEKEIVCVDDCSTDGTWDILVREAQKGDVRIFRHQRNMGKGAAVRTGLEQAEGDIVIIQDADLEYNPEDYYALLAPILSGKANVVYGSRFLGQRKDMKLGHAIGNRVLTLVTNLLYGAVLTDMETCYKVFTKDVAKQLKLVSPRWGFDPEITARILKSGHRIYEVPISYTGRQRHEGKKIHWKDGIVVLLTLLRLRFFD